MIPLLCSTVLLLPITTLAQQASAAWRKPNVTVVRGDRISIAEAAIEEGIAFLDTSKALFPDPDNSYGLSGAFYSQLAEFDLATNQTKYAAALQQYFLLAAENLGELGGSGNYGHAAAMAFSTYKNPVFLQYAEQVWWAVNAYTLTQKNVDSGTIALKNFTLGHTCQGITIAGGTFREKLDTATAINTQATGLSALLAEATQDDLYLDAAKASADFIRAHLYNANNIVQDSISARANDSCAEAASEFSSDSGVVIEGLAILYSITHNASIHDMIGDMLTSVIPHTGWQGPDGIIANGAEKTSDLILPRALATVKARNATTPLLQSYIDAYLSVQFNAILDLATVNGSNIYAGSWIGPPSLAFSPGNQTNAIQVLIGAINIGNQPSNSSESSQAGPSASSGPSAAASPRQKSKVGPIIGGVVGGLIVLVGLIVGALLCRRRMRSRANAEESPVAGVAPPQVTQVTPTTVHPFELRANHAPPSAMPSSTLGSPIQSVAGHGNTTTTLSTAHGTRSMSAGSSTQESTALLYPSNNDEDGDADEPPPDYRASEFHK
ncbi:hypothetical protein DFH08DRAFT_874337 [Mycena albidolilacea]|uniref:Glycoside hydrolase family 76 protein n=1 Tax=Mycena albidolilacea TaxID=1033008 RepID=A0AAD7EPW0_9AGAR|nr:hypothetical protein DFH08DRAFT_874337 [Mycena albidolilacea]